MFDKVYRQRLQADLAQWEADGVIAPAAAASIRNVLPPLSPGVNIAVVVAIVGGLLIAAAFLAFVAAHWTEIARLLRFAILLAGMVVAGGLGAWFATTGRTVLADLCTSIGAIIFGAGIALVGQMYHLGDDHADEQDRKAQQPRDFGPVRRNEGKERGRDQEAADDGDDHGDVDAR